MAEESSDPRSRRIAFIVPAYNEARLIGQTLGAIREAIGSLGLEAQLIVVDDRSTDATASIAADAGAKVVAIDRRQIAAARNAGAQAADAGVKTLFFVDADTTVSERTIDQAIRALEAGAVGGGAAIRFAESAPLPGLLAMWTWNRTSKLMHWAAGCFIFAARSEFEAVGGFDEQYFASEELALSAALKKRGPVRIVDPPVRTSARKLRLYSIWTHFYLLGRYLWTRGRSVNDREELGVWYDGRREG